MMAKAEMTAKINLETLLDGQVINIRHIRDLTPSDIADLKAENEKLTAKVSDLTAQLFQYDTGALFEPE